jgi:asparagine synthase (glutamine-hydrolysing)
VACRAVCWRAVCGIAGILRVHPPGTPPPPPELAIPGSWLDILDDSIKHRGPDGQGRFRDRAVRPDGTVVDVALVHRRLAIIDIKDGHQPMVSARGRNESEGLVAVIFNGCIYNHRELRKELQAAGHRFETDHSDTEVLVHGWREWGEGVTDRLDGMYAFAIWDRQTGSFVLARDRAGEKPFYYTDELGPIAGLAMASTPAALMRLSAMTRGQGPNLDPGLMAHWIKFGFGSGTPSWEVQAVHPGSLFDFDLASRPLGDHGVRWASPMRGRERETTSLSAARVEELLRQSVTERLEAEVPLGCFLSGGVDSPLVARFAQDAMVQRGGRLQTYTVRMPSPEYDESAAAERIARHVDARHTVLDTDPRPAEELPNLIRQLGLPFGDSSLLPAYWVSRAARTHVAVSLAGDGGDELFCGYERHVADRWLRAHRRLLAAIPLSVAAGGGPRSVRSKVRRLVAAARSGGYPELVAVFPRDEMESLAGPVSPVETTNPAHPEGYWFDRSVYLPEDLLRKSDTASMAVALEVRSPFLSGALIDACNVATEAELMPRCQRKGLLRQVARKYLPAEIVDRPKMGFAIPIGEWFRTDYGGMKQLLLDHLNSVEPWGPPSLGIDLNMKFVRQMLDEHLGTGMSGRIKRDHSQRLYMLLVLSIWAKWLGGLR